MSFLSFMYVCENQFLRSQIEQLSHDLLSILHTLNTVVESGWVNKKAFVFQCAFHTSNFSSCCENEGRGGFWDFSQIQMTVTRPCFWLYMGEILVRYTGCPFKTVFFFTYYSGRQPLMENRFLILSYNRTFSGFNVI